MQLHARTPTPITTTTTATCKFLLHETRSRSCLVIDRPCPILLVLAASRLAVCSEAASMVMGKAAEGARCRRHSRHRQGAGVCAFCLRERLSHLSTSSSSLPSVVRGEERAGTSSSSSCSEASTGCSSAADASSGRASPGLFRHDETTRRAGARRRVSLLTRHERVVGDADAVAAFLQAKREQKRTTTTTAATSFWAKLLHATTRGGGAKRRQQDDGCSLAHSKTTLQERVAAAKWVLF